MPPSPSEGVRDLANAIKPIQEKLLAAKTLNEFYGIAATLTTLAANIIQLHREITENPKISEVERQDAAAIGKEVAAINEKINAHLAKLNEEANKKDETAHKGGGRKTRRARRKALTRRARR